MCSCYYLPAPAEQDRQIHFGSIAYNNVYRHFGKASADARPFDQHHQCSPTWSVFPGYGGVLLPAVASTPPKQRRVVALGHISLLTRSRAIQCEAESRLYLPILTSVLRLFTLPQLKPTEDTTGGNNELNVTDLEEHGYQVGFSKLSASETIGKRDPFEGMVDPRDGLASGLVKAGEAQPGKIPALITQVPADIATPYLQWLAAAGYQINFIVTAKAVS
ncbi:hypothetical protein PSHT_09205 [Puccinia striiformis]|uniref:Exportin-2 C-terminal domain-containing protein n=1 Tax=Puccinia striiformis TaxID=27350 RepID=A0A2S4VIJ7_9BASI|nr:hypothetical protein PSHT_09205 [Puccinia striiformis]